MSINVLGTPQRLTNGDTYTAEAGASTVLMLAAFEEFLEVTATPKLGDVAFTIPTDGYLKNTGKTYLYFGFIQGEDIPSDEQAFTLGESGTIDGSDVFLISLENAQFSKVTMLAQDSATTHSVSFTSSTLSSLSFALSAVATTPVMNSIAEDWTAFAGNGNGTVQAVYGGYKTITDTEETAETFSVDYNSSASGVTGVIEFTEIQPTETVTISDADSDYQHGDEITFSTSGLNTAEAFQSVTLTDSKGNVFSFDSFTHTSATLPAYSYGLGGVLFENSLALTVTDADGLTAVARINLEVPDGYTLTTFEGVENFPAHISENLELPMAIGDQLLHASPLIKFSEVDGSVTYYTEDEFTADLYIVSADGGEHVLLNTTFLGEVIPDPGITGITGSVSASATFEIDLYGLDELATGEEWNAFITIDSTDYPLTVNSQTSAAVNVTAPDDLPDSTTPVLTLQRRIVAV